MNWARRREWTVVAILTSFVLAVLAIIAFAIFYHTPTCTDSKQNGDELGIDCGGSCSTVCSAEAQKASVRFARILQQSGRNDLIAYIDNPNTDAYASRAELLIDVYAQGGGMIEKRAFIPLLANGVTPLFLANIWDGPTSKAFVSFASGSPAWTKGTGGTEKIPKAVSIKVGGSPDAPRVTAVVQNPTAYPERSVPFSASVFAADGTVVAASQTVVELIPPQGTAEAIFTWNEPFSSPYARIEVLPLLSLPSVAP